MVPRRFAWALVCATACGFLNPLGETQDGSPPRARLRMGIASATLQSDCSEERSCWVQLELAHTDAHVHRVEVASVRVVDVADRGGAVAFGPPLVWTGDGYAPWNGELPAGEIVKLSIPIERIRWTEVLGDLDVRQRLYELDLRVVVEVDCDGEHLSTPSIFTVTPVPDRPVIVT